MGACSQSYSGPELYQRAETLETPCLTVDLDVMRRNLEDFVSYSNRQNVTLRSHAKSHKIPDIAHLQHRLTKGGIVCQKISEAEVMAVNGIEDIYLSYCVVDERKLDRLVWVSEKIDQFATTVDGPENIERLQQAAENHTVTLSTVLELDVGLNRTGVKPGDPAVQLAKQIHDQPNLSFQGVMAYEGHIGYQRTDVQSREDYERECFETMETVADTVSAIEEEGVRVNEVMAGSTATAKYTARHPIVTEIHPGMYPFYDARLRQCMPEVSLSDCAMTVQTMVISKPTKDRVIVDAGSKALSLDIDQDPVVKDLDAKFYNASEEHGWIDISNCNDSVEVGDRLDIVMPHVCTTVNLHDTLIGVRDGIVEEIWAVAARGQIK